MLVAALTAALRLLDTKNLAIRHLPAEALRVPCERTLVAGVRAASVSVERRQLIATRIEGEFYLWYGDPDYASGRIPFGVHGYRNYQDGHPVEARAIYRVIGLSCNLFINAADRHLFAGTGAGCGTWRPSKADLIAARYEKCHASAITQ